MISKTLCVRKDPNRLFLADMTFSKNSLFVGIDCFESIVVPSYFWTLEVYKLPEGHMIYEDNFWTYDSLSDALLCWAKED